MAFKKILVVAGS